MAVKIITYVLDDDREELELMKPYLEKICGIELSLHTDVDDFILAIKQGAHVAIIDYKLGGKIDGVEVGKRVLEKNSLCYLIMYSGNDDKRTVKRAMNAGFRYFVDKNDGGALNEITQVVESQMKSIQLRVSLAEKYKNKLSTHAG